MPKKAVTLLVVVILVYAMVRDPTGSASLVSRAISGLTQGAGALIDGFFTFINALIP